MAVGVGLSDGVPLGVSVGVTVGVSTGVDVGVSTGVDVGVSTGVAVGLGVGVGDPSTIKSQIARRGFMLDVGSTVEFVGSEKVGTLSPPDNIAAVPVGDTKTTFELSAVAVSNVHGTSQKIVGVSTGVSVSQGPDDV